MVGISSALLTGVERCEHLHAQFLRRVKDGDLPRILLPDHSTLTQGDCVQLFRSQLVSRHLDYVARRLKQNNKSFYTIGSAGHEGSAAVAHAFNHNDMAFLHYRSGAFMVQRAQAVEQIDIISDVLRSLMAAASDPISQGRHKVFGHPLLNVPPQTSTIASHLPKALGTAVAIKRAQSLGIDHPLPDDSVVLCSFGDASVNHATALASINAAQWIARSHFPLPLVWICEDNGLGVSVATPSDWIENMYCNQPYLHYMATNGLDFVDVHAAAQAAANIARSRKEPVFLHMKCVRLLGHAGVDYELDYRADKAIAHDERCDPLIYSAGIVLANNALTSQGIMQLDAQVVAEIDAKLDALGDTSCLQSADTVMASIVPPKKQIPLPELPVEAKRQQVFAQDYPGGNKLYNLSQTLNLALTDLMLQYENIIVFGEDVAQKGGVYKVTKSLSKRMGSKRVFDSLLDETTILGQAIGHAHNGFLPIPEIQFFAYFHNAQDQLRGEAATLPFFSAGQYANPMVIRIASFAYQKGFGGHFHNDNSFALLRDIPGIIVACPAHPSDAAALLRACVQLAYLEQRVVVFLEPIALYMQKDLHNSGDRLWLSQYQFNQDAILPGQLAVRGSGQDAVIITYGNGFYLSCKAQGLLAEKSIDVTVIDLRWLVPIDYDILRSAMGDIKQVLIVDECRASGSLSEALMANLASLADKNVLRLCAKDSFITLGTSWQTLLPDEHDIVTSIESMCLN